MKNVRVVNLRTYRAVEGEVLIRVDRGSALGNPFLMKKEEDRDLVIEKYRVWLAKQLESPTPQVAQMLEIVKMSAKGAVALGCWCAPKACHADIIVKCLENGGIVPEKEPESHGFTDYEKAAAKAACGEITEFFPTSGDAPRVVFCGSREWAKEADIIREINALPPTAVVISGGCRGADLMAERAAIERRLHTIELCADWERRGKRAGYLRNEAMLDLLDPKTGVVYAFQVKGSVGTQLTIDSARKRGLTVRLFRDETVEHVRPAGPKTGGMVADEVHQKPHKPLDRLSEALAVPSWTCPDCDEADCELHNSGVPEEQRVTGFRDITTPTCPICGRKKPARSGSHEIAYELIERTDLVASVMDDSIVGAYWAGKDPSAGNRIGFELSCPECGQPIVKGKCACGLYSRAQAVVDADDAIFKEDESKLTDDLPTNAYAHAVGCTCPSCLDDRIGKRIASQKAHGADCRCASCLNGFKDAGFIEIPVSLGHPKTCNCGSCRDRRETLAILY